MIIPVDFAQVNFIFQGPAAPRGAQVVIGVDNSSSSLSAGDVAAAARDAWGDNFTPLQGQDITLTSVKAKLGPNDTGAEATISALLTGALAEETLPPQVTMLITKQSLVGGRKGKGRMNIPGLTEDSTAGAGTWDTSTLTAWGSAADDFLAQLAAGDIPMVILHTDVTTPTPVNDLSVQGRSATQRRRIRKAGGRRAAP